MTTHQYIIAWVIYLVGASGCLAVWWRMTRSLGQGFPQRLLRMIAVSAVLTPAISTPGMGFLGPALLICCFDGLSHGSEAMLRTAPVVLVSLLIATLLAALAGQFTSHRKGNRNTEQPKNTNHSHQKPALQAR